MSEFRARTRQVELVEAGRAVGGKGWQNKGYIFPDGFRSRTVFRSSVDPEQVCLLLFDMQASTCQSPL